MKLLPLQHAKAPMRLGAPLPYSVHDAAGKLLLARGRVVPDEATLNTLLERGAFFEVEDPASRRGEAIAARAADAPGRWHQMTVRAGLVLRHPPPPELLERTAELSQALLGMAEKDADLLLFLALRGARDPASPWGVAHAMHAGALAALLSRTLEWTPERQAALVGGALTMNLAVVELQTRLGGDESLVNPVLRATLDRHPEVSTRLLREAGLADDEWLHAVAEHHRAPAADAPAAVALLHFVERYTTRSGARGAPGNAPPLAARELAAGSGNHPFALLLLKTLGLYPPGCFVRLASGETAIVVHRGEQLNAPVVACLTNRSGDALQRPLRRETAGKEHAVAGIVADADVKVRFEAGALFSL